MRTSNKILLAGFVATILIITSIHFVLHAKIKNGNLVTLQGEKKIIYERVVFYKVKHVVITGLEELQLATGDSAALQVRPEWRNEFEYRMSGDTLILKGAGLEQLEYQRGAKKYAPHLLKLPAEVSLTVNYSRVLLRGADDSANAASRTISINHSELNVVSGTIENTPAYWKVLQVNASHSQTIFSPGSVVNELSVNLNAESSLTDSGADLQHFSLQVDSTSTISLRKKSLNNIKLVK